MEKEVNQYRELSWAYMVFTFFFTGMEVVLFYYNNFSLWITCMLIGMLCLLISFYYKKKEAKEDEHKIIKKNR